jgi:hypothetical protein
VIKNSLIKPYYNILCDLIKHFDKINLSQLITLVTKSTIYSIIKKANVFERKSGNFYPPFLPQIDKRYRYTLVLDLDETLIHYIIVKQALP